MILIRSVERSSSEALPSLESEISTSVFIFSTFSSGASLRLRRFFFGASRGMSIAPVPEGVYCGSSVAYLSFMYSSCARLLRSSSSR